MPLDAAGSDAAIVARAVVNVAGSDAGNAIGIKNTGTLVTGKGADRITVSALSEARPQSASGGNAIGLQNQGSIRTGEGSDAITAKAKNSGESLGSSFGIENAEKAVINLGHGNDSIIGSGGTAGINNQGKILLGQGNDQVTALGPDSLTGFAGGGLINLGAGHDRITGFGAQTVNGGSGYDAAVFSFDLTDKVTLGSTARNAIDITVNGQTMSFTNVESFKFNQQTLSLRALQNH